MESRFKQLGYHERMRLMSLKDRCYDNKNKLIESKIDVFAKAVKEFNTLGYYVVKYDMMVAQLYDKYHIEQRLRFGDGTSNGN